MAFLNIPRLRQNAGQGDARVLTDPNRVESTKEIPWQVPRLVVKIGIRQKRRHLLSQHTKRVLFIQKIFDYLSNSRLSRIAFESKNGGTSCAFLEAKSSYCFYVL